MNLFLRFYLVLLLAWLHPCLAESLSEGQIKSAYVLNFAKFVEWPAGTAWADNKIVLCVVGSNVLGGTLLELDGRMVGSRELSVVQHRSADGNLKSCHIVFVGESEYQRAIPIIKALGDSPILTISDIADFAENGGCIRLLFHDKKIVFDVNLESAQKSKLRLSSQLLIRASHVFGK